jgi:putative hemolysin
MYGEPQIAHFLEPYLEQLWFEPSPQLVRSMGYFIGLSILTYLHVVIGEMVPKSVALTNPSGMVLFLSRPMQISQAILTLPVRFLNSIGNGLLRVFRIPPAEGHARVPSPEELELLVTESHEVG